MSKEDLKHPRINILYIRERKQDAEKLYSVYANLGAKIALLEVEDDESTRKHLGKLYYFDKIPRFAEIADSLAKNIQKIEKVSPQYIELNQRQQANYAIWIVAKVKSQTIHASSILTKPRQSENLNQRAELEISVKSSAATAEKNSLLQCPKCKSLVRNDRLTKHLAKTHSEGKLVAVAQVPRIKRKIKRKSVQPKLKQSQPSIPNIKKLKRKESSPLTIRIENHRFLISHGPVIRSTEFKFRSSTSSSSASKVYCRHCGRAAINGTDVCYTCNPK